LGEGMPTAEEWRAVIGKRILVHEKLFSNSVDECSVMEVSGSGKFVSLKFRGYPTWYDVTKFEILEVLGPAPMFCKTPCPFNYWLTPVYYQITFPGTGDEKQGGG